MSIVVVDSLKRDRYLPCGRPPLKSSPMRCVTVAAIVALVSAGCGRHADSPGAAAPAAAHDSATPASHPPDHAGPPQTVADWARGAKLFDRLGTFHRAVTTSSPEAQRYFDQGMRLLWAFNHDEATRS